MKEFKYLLGFLLGLPAWLKVLFYVLLGAFIVAVTGYAGVRIAIVAAVALVVIGLLLMVATVLARWARNRREAELRGEFDAPAPPTPEAEASLGELRKRFAFGLDKFQTTGKDLYELPWFAFIGEPAAGKTEAVRRSGLEFAKDLQPPRENGGGTRGLDWWFTNHAVVLDVAGDVVFGATSSPTTPQWRELTGLLKKHRPACPLNGVVLAIPADSLLHDSAEEIERKAGVIARHLDVIQRELNIKCPVFAVVTRSDAIEGFRPFFADLQDAKALQQMLGWSNPAPLEAPFRSEILDDDFRSLAQRLRRLRLGILLDPTPRHDGGRRVDEVDGLFAVPDAIEALLPNLRRYVENIFVAGEWSARPMFLRGIYYTSALQGMPDSPPRPALSAAASAPFTADEGWQPERAIFLRDLFLDKIFREDSLVPSAGVSSRTLFRRRLTWFGLGLLAIVALFWAALDGFDRTVRSVGSQQGFWDRAASGWKNKTWNPIVTPDPGRPGFFTFAGDNRVGAGQYGTFGGDFKDIDLDLDEFQQALTELSAVPLEISWTFWPFTLAGTNPNTGRLLAQKVVFESGVARPLLEAARLKMARPILPADAGLAVTEASLTREARALTALVRVETSLVARYEGKFTENPGAGFINPLLEYVCDIPDSPRLVTAMNWTYDVNPDGRHTWAPDWARGGASLDENAAINAGINRLITFAKQRVDQLDRHLATLQRLAEVVERYVNAENALAKPAANTGDWTATGSAVANAFENLEDAKNDLEQRLRAVSQAGLFEDGPATLSSALERLTNGSDSHLGQVNVILTAINEVLPLPDADQPGNVVIRGPIDPEKFALLQEIRDRLTGVSTLIKDKIQAAVTPDLIAKYRTLDQEVLAPYENMPAYLWRWNTYTECAAGVPRLHFNSGMYLVDQRFRQLADLVSALDSIQSRVDTYSGKMTEPFLTICNYFLQRSEALQADVFVTNYVQQATAALLRVARFPLVWPPGPDNTALDVAQLSAGKQLLNAVRLDLQAGVFVSLPAEDKLPATDFLKQITPLFDVVNALIKPDGGMAKVSVTLYNGQAQRQLSGPNYSPLPEPTPSPSPPPRSLMNKLFFGLGSKPPVPPPPDATTIDTRNWNAVELLGNGVSGVFPLSSQSDILLGTFEIQDPFSFRVYRSPLDSTGTDDVSGGANWSALRLIARLGGKPLGIGQDWQIPLKPNEPNQVWMKFSFELPLPTTPWPTLETLGLNQPVTQ